MNQSHEARLDDVALYALGLLPADAAAEMREHLPTCSECREEYDALAFAPEVLARSLPLSAPSDLLKSRIMRDVRERAATASTAPEKGSRSALPAYLAAVACLVIAVVSAFSAINAHNDLRDARAQLSAATSKNAALQTQLAADQIEVADLLGNGRRYPVAHGEVVRSHNRIYLALHDLKTPASGHVYQAWTLPRGKKAMAPSVTFTPDRHGDAVVPIPADADLTTAVAVSVEPDGGSKAPTTKPILVTTLD